MAELDQPPTPPGMVTDAELAAVRLRTHEWEWNDSRVGMELQRPPYTLTLKSLRHERLEDRGPRVRRP